MVWLKRREEEGKPDGLLEMYGSLEYQRVKVDGFLDYTNKTKVNGSLENYYTKGDDLQGWASVTYLINNPNMH